MDPHLRSIAKLPPKTAILRLKLILSSADHKPLGPFAGVRYWKDSDPSLMLIFDVNGIIAGIQTAVPKTEFTPMAGPTVNHPWIDDGNYWVLTAYFVDPSEYSKTYRLLIDWYY